MSQQNEVSRISARKVSVCKEGNGFQTSLNIFAVGLQISEVSSARNPDVGNLRAASKSCRGDGCSRARDRAGGRKAERLPTGREVGAIIRCS